MMPSQELYRQAMSLFQRGRMAEAEALFGQLVAANPQAFAPRHMLGLAMAQQDRPAEAR